MGQPMEDGVRRQAFLHFGAGAYVIRYRFDREGSVVVVRVWHSRERRET
jgi:plasmid stabilization system protein ParE